MMNDRFRFRIWEIKEKRYNKYPPYGYQGGTFNMFSTDESLIEQCTGIKDSNGDLIYEGDIVEFDGDFCGDIAWDEDAGCWAIRTIENTIYTFDNLYGYELTVIGNIHENPELLEQRNE